MKKKLTFSFLNIFESTQKEIVDVQNKFKAGFAVVAGSTYIMSNAKYTIGVLMAGFLCDLLLGCLKIEAVNE